MSNMLGFLNDRGNYKERVVGRDDYPWGFISTARVSDGAKPFETAIKCDKYVRRHDKREGLMCIVEAYDTREQAEKGHAIWLKAMTSKILPKTLTDCCNAEVAQLASSASEHDYNTFELVKS